MRLRSISIQLKFLFLLWNGRDIQAFLQSPSKLIILSNHGRLDYQPAWSSHVTRHERFFHTFHQSLLLFKGRSLEESDDEYEPFDIQSENYDDWTTAEFTLRSFPYDGPDADFDSGFVAIQCLRSLQFVDYPFECAGLERIFEFLTWECRKCVTGRQGGDSVERFCKYGALAPALQPLMGAIRIELGEPTVTPRTPTRGTLVSYPIIVHGARELSFQHGSGMIRNTIGSPPLTNMVIRLEQERLPPKQGCWLIKEILDVRYAFQGDMGNDAVAN